MNRQLAARNRTTAINPRPALQPIIVIGMHRSGTSLLARLMQDLGVYMGADCNAQHTESQCMLALNERMLASVGAAWHKPEAAMVLFEHKLRRPRLAESVWSACHADGTRFTGDSRVGLFEQQQPWGWKDPRTTLTLPVWLSIFPGAKIIEIVRNGVDVAQSLITRERRSRRFTPQRHHLSTWLARLRSASIGGRVLQCARSPARWISRPLRPRDFPDLDRAFVTWTVYLECCRRAVQNCRSSQHLRLRFEDLLSDPLSHLMRIQEFIGLSASHETKLEELTASIRSERSTAFGEDGSLRRFYEKVRHHPRMIEHGYDDLV